MHQRAWGRSQVSVLTIQRVGLSGLVDQSVGSSASVPDASAAVLVQRLQLPRPGVVLDELRFPVRTQPDITPWSDVVSLERSEPVDRARHRLNPAVHVVEARKRANCHLGASAAQAIDGNERVLEGNFFVVRAVVDAQGRIRRPLDPRRSGAGGRATDAAGPRSRSRKDGLRSSRKSEADRRGRRRRSAACRRGRSRWTHTAAGRHPTCCSYTS